MSSSGHGAPPTTLQRKLNSTDLPPNTLAFANQMIMKDVQHAAPGCRREDFDRAAALSDMLDIASNAYLRRWVLTHATRVAHILVEYSPTLLASPQRRSLCIISDRTLEAPHSTNPFIAQENVPLLNVETQACARVAGRATLIALERNAMPNKCKTAVLKHAAPLTVETR